MSVFPRVIPVLLVSDGYLVKPVKFKGEQYVGDPINAVRIFNDKQVDELVICDIDASVKGTGVNYALIEEIASEAFMPVGYGGGVASAVEARRITGIGQVRKALRPPLTSKQLARPARLIAHRAAKSSKVSLKRLRRRVGLL